MDSFLIENESFRTFGRQHFLVLGILILLSIVIPRLAKRWSYSKQVTSLRITAVLISGTVIIWTIIKLGIGGFNYKTDLPIDICNLLALSLPFVFWKPSLQRFELFVYWVFLGTFVALLTPHLVNGFPNYTFFKYWIVHGGLVLFFVYLSVVFEYVPSRKSIFRSFLGLQVYFIFAVFINLALGSNYVYLLGKPPTVSPLDWFGPWPFYILIVDLIGLIIFVLIWKAFQWTKKE
ncbi:MAG: TIGR02206 family membrane protein, partial [Bacteroidota bacterium]